LTCSLSLFLKDLFIYFRESACTSGKAEGEGERESQADSTLSTEPDVASSQDPEIMS